MNKVSGDYDAVVLGVSQQIPSKRLSGQHWEQVNLISDPVRGLRRRPGARALTSSTVFGVGLFASDLHNNYRVFDVTADDLELSLLALRPQAAPVGYRRVYASVRGGQGALTDGQFLGVSQSATALALLDRGINSVTAAGDYILLAHNKPVGSTSTVLWQSEVNRRMVVIAVKQGTYSRTYTLRLQRVGGGINTVSYTTPALYNTDGSINPAAAAAVQPANIAAQLEAQLAAIPGFTGPTVFTLGRKGSTILLRSVTVDMAFAEASDGGDNSHIKVTWRTVKDPADLPATSFLHHIVQVQPTTDGPSYYLRAEADSAAPDVVTWREYAATIVQLVSVFCIGRVWNGTLYIGASPTDLDAHMQAAGYVGALTPAMPPRLAGDDDSAAVPHFVGRVVTDLRVFQDRLLVCSGNVVTFSQIGQYFNFWRSTMLTYPDDDAGAMYATGSEPDTLRTSVVFDRSLIFFGDKQQYAVSGKVPLTGSTATMMQSSAHRDAGAVRPLTLGDLLFYVKADKRSAGLYQIEVGNVEDTSRASEVSKQLHDYVRGEVIEVVGLSSPNTILVRTTEPNVVYVYTYMDAGQGQRVFDSWSRWEFDLSLGRLIGLALHEDNPRLWFVRPGSGPTGVITTMALDVRDDTNTLPTLDGWFYLSEYTGAPEHPAINGMRIAYTAEAPPELAFKGRQDSDSAALVADFGYSNRAHIVVGAQVQSYVVLTRPFITDKEGSVVTGGKLVVSTVDLELADTSACAVVTELPWAVQPGALWEARHTGFGAFYDSRPQDGKLRVSVRQDADLYKLRISAKDWLPMTLAGVSWIGQYFKRTRSV